MEKLKVADAGRSKQQGEREMDKQKEYQNTRGNPPPTKHLSRPALWPSQPPGMRPFFLQRAARMSVTLTRRILDTTAVASSSFNF